MILLTITSFLERVRRRWRQRQTERTLRALPRELQKDIGWPSSSRWMKQSSRENEC